MKILIIGTSRSGTTSLLNGISEQNYTKISEPFNDRFRDTQLYPINLSDNNVCVKTLVFQKPNQYSNIESFYKSFVNKFDKVILLDRYDLQEHWISNINLHYKNKLKETLKLNTWPSHDKWFIDEITEDIENEVISDGWYEFFKKEKNLIRELSINLKIDITLYENLYGNDRDISLNIIKDWNLSLNSKKLNEYLNPIYKYKQKNPKKLI